MKLLSALALAPLLSTTFAHPLDARQEEFQTVDLVFHAGPASYRITIPADGEEHATIDIDSNANALNINIIDTPIFSAYHNCAFTTPFHHELIQSINRETGAQSLLIGPPQPIISVRCWGTCVPNYSECPRNGQGRCCAGYCAAIDRKCTPWI